jgi:hypothetical protein
LEKGLVAFQLFADVEHLHFRDAVQIPVDQVVNDHGAPQIPKGVGRGQGEQRQEEQDQEKSAPKWARQGAESRSQALAQTRSNTHLGPSFSGQQVRIVTRESAPWGIIIPSSTLGGATRCGICPITSTGAVDPEVRQA